MIFQNDSRKNAAEIATSLQQILYGNWPLGVQREQLVVVIFQRHLRWPLCACLVIRHEDDASSVRCLLGAEEFLQHYVGGNGQALKMCRVRRSWDTSWACCIPAHFCSASPCRCISRRSCWSTDSLPTPLEWDVMRSPPSVCPSSFCPSVCLSVCFHSIVGTNWPLTLKFFVWVGHDHSSQGIEGQSDRSRSMSWVRLMRSVRPRLTAVSLVQHTPNA